MTARATIPTLLSITAALAGCTGGTTTTPTPQADWHELQLQWMNGTELRFQGETHATSSTDEWITDGEAYLYARAQQSAADREGCIRSQPPRSNGTYVFMGLVEGGCHWARHPSVACLGASFCDALNRPAGPTVPPGLAKS